MRKMLFIVLVGIILTAVLAALMLETPAQIGNGDSEAEQNDGLDEKITGEREIGETDESPVSALPASLHTKPWEWVSASFNDGRTIVPARAGTFVLAFNGNGSFSATTDCNNVGGSFTADADSLSFGEMMSTLMYCENSQESEFTRLLSDTATYHFTDNGTLVLGLKFDSGTVTFR